ncbi:MAG: helix-turn-helix transcriptional regulator [Lachnospiraceae bacterium]|nr:helix-turn-helix transcriptional regulator [Lachnospiraceae bacterium]
MAIGEQIKILRKQHHLTQKQLAEKAGIAEITIRQYEAGKYNPKINALSKLCLALDCKITDLIDEDSKKYYRMFDDKKVTEKIDYDHSYSFASSEEEFNKLQEERQIELEKKKVSNIHKYDATIEVTPEALERLKEDTEAREILKKYESGEEILESEYKKVIEYLNRMMERSKLLQDWVEWYKSTCEPLNNEGRKKVAEYAGTLAETDKYSKPKEWFQGKMTKEEIENAVEAYLSDDNSHESDTTTPEPSQE